MSLDQQLRSELRGRAESYAPPVDLLAGVRRRRTRTLRRRQAGAAAFAALLLVVLGPILLLRPSTVAPSPGEAVRLAAAPAAPTFPLTPTWTPGWVGLRTFTYQAGVGTTLRYERTYPRGATLVVTVGPAEPAVSGELVTVGSHQATIDERTDRIEVAWATSGGWVLVAGIGRVTREEVLQFAASLEETPLQMEVPFALTVAPEGAQLVGFDRSSMEFRRPGASGVRLTITLVAAPEADRPVDEFRGLAIEADPGWGLTDGQLDMILHGVRVNDIALTGGG
jgi:hypothetical protein